MKTSVTFSVLALFAAVMAAYFLWEPQPLKNISEPKAPVMEKIMPADEKAPVRWLQIQNMENNQILTLEKKGETWMLRFPVESPADTFMVDGLATALRVSNRSQRMKPEKIWEEYGLLKPSLKIGVETEPGHRRYLCIGDHSPVGTYYYARWEGESEYFLISEDFKKAFSRSLYSLRLKQVFRTPLNQVTKMRIRTLDKEYEVEKKEDTWYWLEPIDLLGKQLEKKYVDQLVSQYADLYVKEFLDNEKRPEAELGFTLTSPWIRLWGTDKGKTVEEIKIGEEEPTRDSFIAYNASDKAYFLIARQNVRKLFQIFETMALENQSEQPPAAEAEAQKTA